MKNKLKEIIKYGLTNNTESNQNNNNCERLTQKYETLNIFLSSLRKGDVHTVEIEKFQNAWQDDMEMFYISNTIKKFQRIIPKLCNVDSSFRNIIRGMLQNNMIFNENPMIIEEKCTDRQHDDMTPMTAWIANNEHYKRERFIIRKTKHKTAHTNNEVKTKEVAFSDAIEKFP